MPWLVCIAHNLVNFISSISYLILLGQSAQMSCILIPFHEKSAARNECHNTSFSSYPTAAMKGHFQNLFLIKVLIISKELPTGRVSLMSHLDKVLNCPLSNSANIRPMLVKQANTVLSGDLVKVKETKVENQTRYNKTNKEDFSTVRHVVYLNSGCQSV